MAGELILIVDDNSLNRKLVRVILESEGYQVQTAVDAQDARRFLKATRPRMILMDFQMPGEDGITLTRELKSDPRTRDILILIVTSYDIKGEEDQARSAGCDDYITKPIDTRQLPELVAKYLQAPKRHNHLPPEIKEKGNDDHDEAQGKK